MQPLKNTAPRQYRVWIVRYRDGPPRGPCDIPPRYWALEPAEDRAMSARQAAAYTEAFNRTILASSRKVWAVAVPVTVRYEGDLQAGQPAGASREKLSS